MLFVYFFSTREVSHFHYENGNTAFNYYRKTETKEQQNVWQHQHILNLRNNQNHERPLSTPRRLPAEPKGETQIAETNS